VKQNHIKKRFNMHNAAFTQQNSAYYRFYTSKSENNAALTHAGLTNRYRTECFYKSIFVCQGYAIFSL